MLETGSSGLRCVYAIVLMCLHVHDTEMEAASVSNDR